MPYSDQSSEEIVILIDGQVFNLVFDSFNNGIKDHVEKIEEIVNVLDFHFKALFWVD